MKKYYSFAILVSIICLIKTAPTYAQSNDNIKGYWMGNLKIDTGEEIRIAFKISQASDNKFAATIDVPDQHAMGIPVEKTEYLQAQLNIEMRNFGIRYQGTLVDEGVCNIWPLYSG